MAPGQSSMAPSPSIYTGARVTRRREQFCRPASRASHDAKLRWVLGSSGDPVRLVGVNLDLFNATTNMLVGSDSFSGVLSGVAVSSLVTGPLAIGNTYRLDLTGTAEGISFAQLAVEFLPLPATLDTTISGPAPAAQANVFTSRTAVASGTATSPLGPGDVVIFEAVTPPSGGLGLGFLQEFGFTLGAGADSIALHASWLPGHLYRLLGINIDLVAGSNIPIASDMFQGVADGVAVSQLNVGGLVPGDYMVRMTGSALNVGNSALAITLGGTVPPPVNVVEPSTLGMFALAVLGLAGISRRRIRPDGSGRMLPRGTAVTSPDMDKK